MSKCIVIMVFLDKNTGKVLSEKRRADSKLYPNQIVFPSGTVEASEEHDLTLTLFRESREEFGVTPINYINVDSNNPLRTKNNKYTLHIYLITKWEGQIPKVVIDKRNELIWESFEEVTSSSTENRAAIVKKLEPYL